MHEGDVAGTEHATVGRGQDRVVPLGDVARHDAAHRLARQVETAAAVRRGGREDVEVGAGAVLAIESDADRTDDRRNLHDVAELGGIAGRVPGGDVSGVDDIVAAGELYAIVIGGAADAEGGIGIRDRVGRGADAGLIVGAEHGLAVTRSGRSIEDHTAEPALVKGSAVRGLRISKRLARAALGLVVHAVHQLPIGNLRERRACAERQLRLRRSRSGANAGERNRTQQYLLQVPHNKNLLLYAYSYAAPHLLFGSASKPRIRYPRYVRLSLSFCDLCYLLTSSDEKRGDLQVFSVQNQCLRWIVMLLKKLSQHKK